MKRIPVVLALLASLVVPALEAGTAHALQLIPNFGFDAGLSGWSSCCDGTGTAGWDGSQDRLGSALSGVAKLTHTAALPAGGLSLFLCLSGPDVAPGAKLLFGMRTRFAEGQTATGQAGIALDYRTAPDCGGSSLGGTGNGANVADVVRGTWITVKRNVGGATEIPVGTKSVKLSLTLVRFSAGTLTAGFDDVYVAPVGTPFCDGLPATLVGDSGANFINGTDNGDVIVGKGDLDWIDGHGGNDHLCGGPGDDALYGGDGDDRLFGQGGKDTLLGAANDDLLDGGGNNDTLQGGTGSDVLRGGSGVDSCYDDISPGATVFRKCEFVPTTD